MKKEKFYRAFLVAALLCQSAAIAASAAALTAQSKRNRGRKSGDTTAGVKATPTLAPETTETNAPGKTNNREATRAQPTPAPSPVLAEKQADA